MKRATHFALRFIDDDFSVPDVRSEDASGRGPRDNFSVPRTHGENFSLRYSRGEVFAVTPRNSETAGAKTRRTKD